MGGGGVATQTHPVGYDPWLARWRPPRRPPAGLITGPAAYTVKGGTQLAGILTMSRPFFINLRIMGNRPTCPFSCCDPFFTGAKGYTALVPWAPPSWEACW
jgi:ABC-type uncharacterized transport system permease subunit